MQINRVYDLSQKRPEFEETYGFGAELELHNSTGDEILVDIQAGKGDCVTERYIEFDYGNYTVRQEYTVGDCIDPVYVFQAGLIRKVSSHSSGYNYYVQELQPLAFCNQDLSSQMLRVANTGVCLEMKKSRLGLAA